MRNRFILPVAAVVGLLGLGLIGGIMAANAGSDTNAGSDITSPETITTVGTIVEEKFFDGGVQDLSVGDSFIQTLDLKSPAGVDLGTERAQCTVGAGGWGICTGTFDITGRGEIVATGMVNFETGGDDFDVPITGGTGDFASARGVAHIHLTENGETDTLELLP
jgi:hypothetical protein